MNRDEFSRQFVDFMGAVNAAQASDDWWAFTVAGKFPFATAFPRRCFESASGKTPAVRARNLKERLNRWLPSGPVWGFLRAVWRLRRVRRAISFKPEPGRRYAVIATLINHQSFDAAEVYRDTYFGELSSHLERSGQSPLVFGSITHDFSRSLKRTAAQKGSVPILPMEYFLGAGDLLKVLAKAMRYRLLGFPLKAIPPFAGRDVSGLLREELRENARASRLFSDLWYRACMEALLRRVPVETLYYPFENRCWERLLVLATRKLSPKTRIIAYQHATVTPNHLNLRLGRGEEKVLPLPDRVVTMGKVTLERLESGGFPPALLYLGCALRQSQPSGAPRTGMVGGRRLLVALATSVEEYAKVLRLLDDAFGQDGEAPDLAVRAHPVFPLSEGRRRAGPLSIRFRELSGTLESSFAGADVVLYASSTLGLEAVWRGIPAVFLDVHEPLSTDPLAGFEALKWTTRDGRGLKKALEEIRSLASAELDFRREAARRYAEDYCGAVTPEALSAFDAASPRATISGGLR